MSKDKLKKFEEVQTFKNVLQPSMKGLVKQNDNLRGKWNSEIFKNNNPIVLEVGCGKGEYSVGLAEKYPNKNFIGIDIKGARIWRGAKTALEKNLKNVFFLRSKIDFLDKFFAENEVSEIWIPHPDPQPKKPNKRLTSKFFLTIYQAITINNALIHLKTDSEKLYKYTLDLLKENNIKTIKTYNNIHSTNLNNEITKIKTYYENMFLQEGQKITYLSFRLNKNKTIVAPSKKEVENYKY
ncbi:MAG: tRNA (guanosine(46)-N7)-methyltransferase TrmB [Bacteroidales bacterium]|nr:tRNA (guanosine(46)-N7)-methyltransferase TrmB [Bacteroidales bacterium]